MRFSTSALSILTLAAATANAQADFATGLLTTLNAAGFTTLATVIGQVANTTAGQSLVTALSNGNYTVFAPTNEAFQGVSSDVSSNVTLLTDVIAYHVLAGHYNVSEVARSPAHTIARTALTGMEFADLPSNRSQAIVLTSVSGGNSTMSSTNGTSMGNSTSSSRTLQIMSNLRNVTASTPITYQNLVVTPVNEVINLPPTLGTLATTAAPAVASLLTTAGLVSPLEAIRGITIFVPSDSAVTAVADAVAQLNETAVASVLSNHVINGTVVYSPALSNSTTATSVGGETLSFSVNSTGAYVTSGNVTAQIVMSDIILTNGVAHVIDRVLVNTASNPTAAESAASVAATASATSDAGVGPTNTRASASASASASTTTRSAGFKEVSSKGGLMALIGGAVVAFAL